MTARVTLKKCNLQAVKNVILQISTSMGLNYHYSNGNKLIEAKFEEFRVQRGSRINKLQQRKGNLEQKDEEKTDQTGNLCREKKMR